MYNEMARWSYEPVRHNSSNSLCLQTCEQLQLRIPDKSKLDNASPVL